MADLIKFLDYDLIGQVPTISTNAQSKVNGHLIVDKEDWTKSFCDDFKLETKIFYARRQGQKCAYCRIKIHTDGYTEPLEHITPRELKPYWMFVQHNLVVSCGGCNSTKRDKNMLRQHENTYGNLPANCPNNSNEYFIFNPHFDQWSDHFEIEDKYFLKPKPNTKGPFTYKYCGLHRYHIIVDYLFQMRVREPFSFKILSARIRKTKDPKRLEVLKRALESIKESL